MAKSNKNIGNDLETTNVPNPKMANLPQYDNREWLENNEPTIEDFKSQGSSKYDEVREPKVQAGLKAIGKIQIDGVAINPLLVLLGKWWEVKPARAAIKKMIDDEAEAKGIDNNIYLQEILAKEIETISEIQTAVDRVRYAKTYFKPRGPIVPKVKMMQVKIDGTLYNVPQSQFAVLKETYKDKETLKAQVLAIAIPFEDSIESL